MGIFNLRPYDWGDYLTIDDVVSEFTMHPPYTDIEASLFSKFKIEFFQPHNGATINFKAFVTQYSESFNSEWELMPVYGRMDPTAHFQRTGRRISLGWTAPASSEKEAYLNLQNASKLAKLMYPVYGENQGNDPFYGSFQDATELKAPPRVILRFSNLIKRGGTVGSSNSNISTAGLHGLILNYNFQPVLDDGFFDGVPEGFDNVALLPKTIAFSVSYLVTHRDANGWTEDGLWRGEQEFPWMPGSAPLSSNTALGEVGGTSGEACASIEGPEDTTQANRDECVAESNESIATDTEALVGAGG